MKIGLDKEKEIIYIENGMIREQREIQSRGRKEEKERKQNSQEGDNTIMALAKKKRQ